MQDHNQDNTINNASFDHFQLAPALLQALNEHGFSHPTQAQLEVIPQALTRRDVLVSAPTGSGKTLAFLLPAIHHLLSQPNPPGIKLLILVPTRELARQIFDQCSQLCRFTGLFTCLTTGGEDFKQQQTALHHKADIVIATPGRLSALLEAGAVDLSGLNTLVLDEADRMLDMGFAENVLAIVEYTNASRQSLLFSATLNSRVHKIAGTILNAPQKITVTPPLQLPQTITQQMVLADDDAHKLKLLVWLLNHHPYGKALIFTNTRSQTQHLKGPLIANKFKVAALHGELDQKQRIQILKALTDSSINVLIATDLAARGMDIKAADLVINFDVPRNAVDYTHRIGRTGRADMTGTAITLVKHNEWNLFSSIQRYLQLKLDAQTIAGLEGSYQGPKKLKASGKSAGGKAKKPTNQPAAKKPKLRHRDQKNIGKRRKPSATSETVEKT
ncbi:MAG: RNA helicase [Methylobacter sp.]|nr:MAG: RNA helicase [Methylobacter sp.]